MKKRNKIVAFLLAGVIAAGHGSVVYAAGYGSVVYEDVAWDLCALNEERMKLEVQEKNTDNDAAGNDQADIEERYRYRIRVKLCEFTRGTFRGK